MVQNLYNFCYELQKKVNNLEKTYKYNLFSPKNEKIVTDFSYHNSSSFMVEMRGVEPRYKTISTLFSTCLFYSKTSNKIYA